MARGQNSMDNTADRTILVAQIIGMAIDGGVEACIMNYYQNIDRTKVQFHFFVESTSKIIDKEKIEKMGGKVIFIPHYSHVFKYMKYLKSIFKRNHYDIVHSNMNALSIFPLRSAKKAGIEIRIAHSHSTSNKKEWKKNIIKSILRRFSKKYSTHYFACSEMAGRWLFGNNTFEEGKVKIINNAIDYKKFQYNLHDRVLMRKKYNLSNKFILGNVGRFVEQKNQLYLLYIFSELKKINSNSCLLLLGDGPLRQKLIDKSKDLGIFDDVIFVGVHKEPEKFYQIMDFFILTSLYEGLPVSGIEAQINGLTCLFSECMTLETKITDSTDFFSINLKPKEVAEKIINNFEKYNNREKIINLEKYDIKFQADRLVEEYYQLIKEEEENGNSYH